jgi:hypothetical protein
LLTPNEPAPGYGSVWIYEGTLEQFTGQGDRFHYRQRVHWPEEPAWEQVEELGQWTAERLSINGHLLVGLNARPEGLPRERARLIAPG